MGKQKLQRCKLPVDSINIKEEHCCASQLPTQSWRTSALGCNIQGLRSLFIIFSLALCSIPSTSFVSWGDNSPFHFQLQALQQSSYHASAACLALKMAGHLEQHTSRLIKPNFRAGFGIYDCYWDYTKEGGKKSQGAMFSATECFRVSGWNISKTAYGMQYENH